MAGERKLGNGENRSWQSTYLSWVSVNNTYPSPLYGLIKLGEFILMRKLTF